MVPEPAEGLEVEAISSHKLSVKYSFKNFEHFPPGLEHEITVCREKVCEITVSHIYQILKVKV